MEGLSRETETIRENPMQILELKSIISEMSISQQLKMAPQCPCLCEDRSRMRGLLWPGQGAISAGLLSLLAPVPPPTQRQRLAREPTWPAPTRFQRCRFGWETAALAMGGHAGILAATTLCISVIILRVRSKVRLMERKIASSFLTPEPLGLAFPFVHYSSSSPEGAQDRFWKRQRARTWVEQGQACPWRPERGSGLGSQSCPSQGWG